MSSAFLSRVVQYLRLRSDEGRGEISPGRVEQPLWTASDREWAHNMNALDRFGLTLPFYVQLLKRGEQQRLSSQTLAAFEQRKLDNSEKMLDMLQSFGEATAALEASGVRHICVKGFSLFPDYAEQLWQRHQSDCDLLVTPAEAPRAQATLEALGYRLTAVAADGERRMRIPLSSQPAHIKYIYSRQIAAAIELHLRFWEPGAEDLSFACPQDTFERAETRTLGSISFLGLSRPHAFLYQSLHIFRHFLGSWVRLLWLYEIASYLHRFREDDALWQEVQALVCSDARLSEAIALVLLVAQDLFACPIPAALNTVHTIPSTSPVRIWIDHYARRWLLADAPGNKLNLLLQKHFFSNDLIWRRYLLNRLMPFGRHPSLREGVDERIAKSFAFRAANLQYQSGRAWYHLRSGIGFAAATISWNRHLHKTPETLSANDLVRESEI